MNVDTNVFIIYYYRLLGSSFETDNNILDNIFSINNSILDLIYFFENTFLIYRNKNLLSNQVKTNLF